jgi:hypothetical protein
VVKSADSKSTSSGKEASRFFGYYGVFGVDGITSGARHALACSPTLHALTLRNNRPD